MSMISAQADELRELAVRANDLYEYEMEVALDGAADTILSLRDRAQELQAENAKLREDNACLVKAIDELHSVKLEDRLVALENENDRLRELVRDMWNWLAPSAIGSGAPLQGIHGHMRKLGIEVGE